MRLSEQGLLFIRQFEGFRALPYRDAARLWTVGYGHLMLPSEQCVEPLTHEAALALLQQDVAFAEAAVRHFIAVRLGQNQFDALVSFTFNLGGAVLQRSTLRRALNRGAYDEVPRQLIRYVFAGGKKLPGLMRRRAAEAALFEAI